jgi:hypothetical protein
VAGRKGITRLKGHNAPSTRRIAEEPLKNTMITRNQNTEASNAATTDTKTSSFQRIKS